VATDHPCPGNVTRSYRTRDPLRVVGEVVGREGRSPDVLPSMRDHMAELARQGIPLRTMVFAGAVVPEPSGTPVDPDVVLAFEDMLGGSASSQGTR